MEGKKESQHCRITDDEFYCIVSGLLIFKYFFIFTSSSFKTSFIHIKGQRQRYHSHPFMSYVYCFVFVLWGLNTETSTHKVDPGSDFPIVFI